MTSRKETRLLACQTYENILIMQIMESLLMFVFGSLFYSLHRIFLLFSHHHVSIIVITVFLCIGSFFNSSSFFLESCLLISASCKSRPEDFYHVLHFLHVMGERRIISRRVGGIKGGRKWKSRGRLGISKKVGESQQQCGYALCGF